MIVLLEERYGWVLGPETLQKISKTWVGLNLEALGKSVFGSNQINFGHRVIERAVSQ